MPNLKIEKKLFNELMGKNYTFEELDDLGFEFGIEVEEDVEEVTQQEKREIYKFDCMNNRPDLLTEASLTRIFKIYLGMMDTPEMKLSPPTTKIVVDPSVNDFHYSGESY